MMNMFFANWAGIIDVFQYVYDIDTNIMNLACQ